MGKANWSNLGSALSGMGAGFSGRGELWRRNQMLAEEQEMREAQRQEMLKRNDALKFSFQALNAHQPGGSPEVIGLIESRLRNLNSAGIDASDTMDLLERYTTNPDAAAAQWQSGLAWAQMSGQLNVPGQGNRDTSAVETHKYHMAVLNDPNATEQAKRASEQALYLAAKPGMNRYGEPAGVPSIIDPNAGTSTPVTASGAPVTIEDVAENESMVANAKASGTAAAGIAAKAYEQLQPVTKSITNLHSAIRAIDDGADSGVFMSKLPSVTEASVTLDNIQSQMGLDIIGATTFGALSESELAFALDTALPTKLDDPELRKWLVRKAKTQKALRAELIKTARYMSNPGATVGKYLDMLESKGQYEKKNDDPLGLFN